jgi:multiple sugar transport system substrate-binding protein
MLAAALNAGIALGAAADPYSFDAIATKDYRGLTSRVLTFSTPALGEPVMLHARQFEALTGAKIAVTRVPIAELYQETLHGLRQNKYDVITFASMWIADMARFEDNE